MTLRYSCAEFVIEFSDPVLETFQRHRQLSLRASESGGQLFCFLDGNNVFVNHATEPGLTDRRSRFSFWPSRRKEQKEINKLFGDGLHYIGDWHTHPENVPSPSGEDIRKIQAIFRESEHILRGILIVIIGRNLGSSGLWVGMANDYGLTEAHLIP